MENQPIIDRNEQKEAKYQTVDDIELIETSADNADYKVFGENESKQDVQRRLKDDYWWLSEHWQNKGLPKEYFSILIGEKRIDMYNWSNELSEGQISDVTESFGKVANFLKHELPDLRFLLIDDTDVPHKYGNEGEMLRGWGSVSQSLIHLRPYGIKEGSYRNGEIGEFSETKGIVVHEFSHFIERITIGKDSLIGLWNKRFSRYNSETGKNEVLKKEQCVSNYAKIKSSEDFSESIVSFIYNPDKLKTLAPEKYQFIVDNIAKQEGEDEISMTCKKHETVELPEAKSSKTYKVLDNSMIEIK